MDLESKVYINGTSLFCCMQQQIMLFLFFFSMNKNYLCHQIALNVILSKQTFKAIFDSFELL